MGFVDLAVLTSRTFNKTNLEAIRSLGFSQIATFANQQCDAIRLKNRWPHLEMVGELKSALMWSADFNLFFFDSASISSQPKEDFLSELSLDPSRVSNLTSSWPSTADRSKVGELRFDTPDIEEFYKSNKSNLFDLVAKPTW